MPDGASLSAVVLYVSDLDRSIDFYGGLLGLDVSLREDEAALLENRSGAHVYLRLMTHGIRASVGVGVQYTIWTYDSEDGFGNAERWLEEHSRFVRRHHYEKQRAIEGRDPDNLAVMVAFPSWRGVHPKEIFSGIFNY